MDTNNTQDLNTKLSAIDKALAAAKARKVAKESSPTSESDDVKVTKSAPDKAEKIAAREAKRAQLAKEREERRAGKAAEAKGPAHMKKIDRAASRLPVLSDPAQLLFNEATSNFSAEQITAISLHLQHFNRVKATERALGQKVQVGQTVKIIAGDPKFVGMTGTVSKSQRIRCYVTVSGIKRDVYCFTSDVEPQTAAQASTGTEG
ncbi:MAG: hypothetical protein FJY85_00260 [Deltaproteobacteria bacterium]|nr:hypothetical protein [Deltaproteobacteria bacterium]